MEAAAVGYCLDCMLESLPYCTVYMHAHKHFAVDYSLLCTVDQHFDYLVCTAAVVVVVADTAAHAGTLVLETGSHSEYTHKE